MHIVNGMRKCLNIIKKWFLSHEMMIVMVIVLIAVAGISYAFGFFHGIELSPHPLMISRPLNEPIVQVAGKCTQDPQTSMTPEDCRFVASINGKKYYPPTCPAAQKIAKENLRCFTSEQDANEKGYELSTSCH